MRELGLSFCDGVKTLSIEYGEGVKVEVDIAEREVGIHAGYKPICC